MLVYLVKPISDLVERVAEGSGDPAILLQELYITFF